MHGVKPITAEHSLTARHAELHNVKPTQFWRTSFWVSAKRWLDPNEFQYRKIEQLIPVTNCCLTTAINQIRMMSLNPMVTLFNPYTLWDDNSTVFFLTYHHSLEYNSGLKRCGSERKSHLECVTNLECTVVAITRKCLPRGNVYRKHFITTGVDGKTGSNMVGTYIKCKKFWTFSFSDRSYVRKF